MSTTLDKEYEQDFYSWTKHNAQLLRQGKFTEVDIENVAEEIESMGRRDRRQLINRLAVLIAHLLKWKHQAIKRSNSWKITIMEQRAEVIELLEESPSLKHELEAKLARGYEKAVKMAAKQTGIDLYSFPKNCPFTFGQCLDDHFFPE